jgi:hypothetical protein
MAIIDKPTDYFETAIWTGDNTSPRNITSLNFQPDMIWGKIRSQGYSHQLFNSISGFGNDKELTPNNTLTEGGGNAEDSGYVSGVLSNGFTVTAGTTDRAYWNDNSETYCSWNWKAGGTASSNTDGSITSSVSANTTSGFSIVSYTGTGANATVGHGLGVAPSMVITKRRSGADDWIVWHKDLTNPASYLYLNGSNIEMGSVAAYQNITPTSILLYPGTDSRTNDNGDTYISYVFADETRLFKIWKLHR